MPWQPREFKLTPQQQQAVDHIAGPILAVAGAGTGKTTVLACRVVRLIEDRLADPREILAVTYTRNSARDLLKRIARLWKGADDPATVAQVADTGLKVGTFHSYCYSLLSHAGRRFELIDDKDLDVLLRRRIADLKLQYYIKAATPGEFLQGLTGFFKRCHDELRTPDDYEAYVAKLESKQIPLPRVGHSKQAGSMSDHEVLGRCHEIARVFRYAEHLLASENLGTYSHVITRAIALLRDRTNATHLQHAQQGARFVLIDEFQDSNVAQIELTRLLVAEQANVFAVGDPDQAIYRFRGATAGAFDHFLKTFGTGRVKRVTMSENRRSTDVILKSAYSVIARNPEITSVELPGGERWMRAPLEHARTKPEPAPVSPVQVKAWEQAEGEAAFVAQEIIHMHDSGRPWRDFAVLYRSHSNRNALVEQLMQLDVPFTVEGIDLLEIAEVRDLLAALRAIESGDSVGLLRVAALPRFRVEGEAVRAALAAAGEDANLEAVLDKVPGGSDVITALAEARYDIQRLQNKALTACGLAQKHFGIASSGEIEGFTQFVENWGRKPRQVSGDGTLREFLEYLDYFIDANGTIVDPDTDEEGTPATLQMEYGRPTKARQQEDAVQLLTVHAAKGLEFPVVFLLRVGSSSLPTNYREDLVEFPTELRDKDTRIEGAPKDVHAQEERRLFYVAITRAEDQLILAGKKGRGKSNPIPSGYLRDLVTAGAKSLNGCVEFGLIPSGEVVSTIHAGTQPMSRIAEWVNLPPLPQTLNRSLSASAIESYERCPLSYKLGIEWNLPEEPAANMQFGSAMHAALFAWFDAVRKQRPMSVDELTNYFLDEFRKAKIEDPVQRELYERDGCEQLRTFVASPAATPQGRVALLEHRFKCEIAGTRVIGRIDRVDEDSDGYVIVDYKTGNPKSQPTADDSLQLSVYALAMGAGKPVKALILQNLEDNTTVQSTRSRENLLETEAKIAKVAAGIAAGEFQAHIGRHCTWCAYRTICPETEVTVPSSVGETVATNSGDADCAEERGPAQKVRGRLRVPWFTV
jgi:DNA helicase-2/ATP-dependent DNA helicase PcrA